MELLYVAHPAFAEHRTGDRHPERPDRLMAVERGAVAAGVDLVRVAAPAIEPRRLSPTHDPLYVEALRRFCAAGGGPLDSDTVAGPSSWEAALRAAGAGLAAVEALESSRAAAAFLAVRPPGHHALPARAMGFCLFNNIAVAAQVLSEEGYRVAVVDWDVHHGNGTQQMFYARADVLYISLHQYPFYPGEGWVDEVGAGAGAGYNLNLPMPAGTAGDVYRAAFERVVVPVLTRFSPDWVLVSAGYDAHADDPLAELNLVESDYGLMSARLAAVAPRGRLAFFLEGGYNLVALAGSVAATLRGAVGLASIEDHGRSPVASWDLLELAVATVGRYWSVG